MKTTDVYYRAEIISVGAWRDAESNWVQNDSYVLEKDVFIHTNLVTRRGITAFLRNAGYLSEASKGKIRVVNDWPLFEIQVKGTGEPILAVIFEEKEYPCALEI